MSHINSYDHLVKTAIFDSDEKIVHGANLLRLRPNLKKIIPAYALFVMKSTPFIENAKRFAQRAINQASINTTDLKNLVIPLPSLKIQKEIVQKIDHERKGAEETEEIIKTHFKNIEITINKVWCDD